jgi:hypothetical protein
MVPHETGYIRELFALYNGSVSRKGSVRSPLGPWVRIRLPPAESQERTWLEFSRYDRSGSTENSACRQ